jgi:putative intracellular protease/amidase
MVDQPKHIGILLFSEVEELDAIGPWEVLSWWTRRFPNDGYAVTIFSESGGLVECAKGLVVQAHHSYVDAPPLEVLIYPGGQRTRPQLHDSSQLNWVRNQREVVPLMTSVLHRIARLCGGGPARKPTSDDALGVAGAAS